MDKTEFLAAITAKEIAYTLPTGEAIKLRRLTLDQRQRVRDAYKTDVFHGAAVAVAFASGLGEEAASEIRQTADAAIIEDIATRLLTTEGLTKEAVDEAKKL
jgi:hypothetical protein